MEVLAKNLGQFKIIYFLEFCYYLERTKKMETLLFFFLLLLDVWSFVQIHPDCGFVANLLFGIEPDVVSLALNQRPEGNLS